MKRIRIKVMTSQLARNKTKHWGWQHLEPIPVTVFKYKSVIDKDHKTA